MTQATTSQNLESHLISQLESLNLKIPPDDVEYIVHLIEEEALQRDEKIEGVKGMLEGFSEGDLPGGIDNVLEGIVDEWERLVKDEEERKSREEEDDDATPPPDPTNILQTLSPAELAQAQKAYLLRQYAYVDDSPDQSSSRPDGVGGGKKTEEEKAAEERRKLIEEALRLDGRKKKVRKAKEVDLLAPNINKEKAQHLAKLERDAQKKLSEGRKERDKAALDKQRADQAKAKADKQKKAAKQERRA